MFENRIIIICFCALSKMLLTWMLISLELIWMLNSHVISVGSTEGVISVDKMGFRKITPHLQVCRNTFCLHCAFLLRHVDGLLCSVHQGVHDQGKSQGKMFSRSGNCQGILKFVREF